MGDCAKIHICPFFRDQLTSMPRTAETLKWTYCHNDFAACARHMVAMKGLPMPPDLFPNEVDRATKLIGEAEQGRGKREDNVKGKSVAAAPPLLESTDFRSIPSVRSPC